MEQSATPWTETTDTEVVNTQFSDQAEVVLATGRTFGGDCNAGPSPTVMPDVPLAVRDILKKPILIRNVQWSTSQTSGTQLYTAPIDVPNVITEFTTVQSNMLSIFAFFKLALRLRIVVNTSKFHQGRLIASIDPFAQMGDSSTSKLKRFNIYSATMLPSAQLDAAQKNVVVLTVPWEHIQDYLTTNSKDSFDIMARVRLTVLNQLKVKTGGTNSVNVQTFMYAEQCNTNVMIGVHPLTVPSFSDIVGHANGISEIIGGVTKMTSAGISAYTNPSSALTSAKEGIEGFNEAVGGFNFDKPTTIGSGYHNCLAPLAPLAHMKGIDNSVRLSAKRKGLYNKRNTFSGAPLEEMLISKLVARKGLAEIQNWTVSQTPGTLIRRIPIMPTFCHWESTGEGFLPRNTNTFLSYLSSYFVYWRGSVEFEFDFVSTIMQTGRLGFAFIPNAVDRSTTFTLEDYANYPVDYFDLDADDKRKNITIPFQSSVPRKLVIPWAGVTEANFTDNHILGYLHIFVQNQLCAPESVVDNVDFNIYISAGSDFELSVPRARSENLYNNFKTTPPAPNPIEKTPVPKCDLSCFKNCVVDNFEIVGHANVVSTNCSTTPEGSTPQPSAPPLSTDQSDVKNPTADASQSREAAPIPKSTLATGMLQVAQQDAFQEGVFSAKDLARRYCKYYDGVFLFTPFQESDEKGKTIPFGPVLDIQTDFSTEPVFAYPSGKRMLHARVDIPVTPLLQTMFSAYDYNINTFNPGSIESGGPYPGALWTTNQGASSAALLMTAMSRMYALWSGGIRFKILPQTNRLTGITWSATYIPDGNEYGPTLGGEQSLANESAYPTTTGNFSQNAAIEIELPFYSVYNQLILSTTTPADPNALSTGFVSIVLSVDPKNVENLPFFDIGESTTQVNYRVYDPAEEEFNNVTFFPNSLVKKVPFLNYTVFAAGADDIAFAYVVSPPETYQAEDIVAPPTTALNHYSNQEKRSKMRRFLACSELRSLYEKFS